MARVSVGLPVYNGERYVEASLQSVLTQTYTDLEVIVSDNGSTDATLEIVERVAGGDARVVLVRNETNRGAAWNYNEVFRRSSGEFFRWHAHDDLLDPCAIEALVDALDGDAGAVLAHTWTQFVDADGEPTELFRDDLQVTSSSAWRRLRSIVRRLTYCNAVFGLVRRDVLARTALIDSFPGSDVPLLYELALHGRFVVVPAPLFVRRPGNSLKSNRSARSLAAWFGPSQRGAKFPGFWRWWASVRAIARARLTVGERAAAMLCFHVTWPFEYVRWLRRRARRRALS